MNEPSLKRDLKDIGISNFILNIVQNIVFLILGYWDFSVLLGSLWGYMLTMIMLFMLAKSVEKAVDKDPKQSGMYMQSTYIARAVVMAVGVYLAIQINSINWISTCIALVFTKVSIMIITYIRRKEK